MNPNFLKHTAFLALLFISENIMAQDTMAVKNQNISNVTTSTINNVKILATKEDKEVVAQAISNLEFEFDKATIQPVSYKSLDGLADWLKARDFTLKVSGYADYIGDDSYNLQLSNERARAVKEYLVKQGADPKLIDPVGFGEKLPLASNENEDGRKMNRRVEFALY